MSRELVRRLKRGLRGPSGAPAVNECAVELLRRSAALGHERLALVRLNGAVSLGADVPPELWAYCLVVAQRSRDPAVREMWQSARRQRAAAQ